MHQATRPDKAFGCGLLMGAADGEGCLADASQSRDGHQSVDRQHRGEPLELLAPTDELGCRRQVVWRVVPFAQSVVAQEDLLLQIRQLGRRVEADLLTKHSPGGVHHAERLALPPAPVERTHQRRYETLPQGVLGNQRFDLRNDLVMAPKREIDLDAFLEQREPQLLELDHGRPRKRFIFEVGKCPAPPQRKGSLQELRRSGRIGVDDRLRLPVKILDKENSRVHDFYNDTRTVDRVYLPEQIVSLFGPFDPYTFNQIFWGIDRERSLIFTAATPLLEDLGIEFKAGDLITYHGVDHEILTVKRKEDSYFDQHDYSFEWAIATYVPNRGS